MKKTSATTIRINRDLVRQFDILAKCEGLRGWVHKLENFMAKEIEEKRDIVNDFMNKKIIEEEEDLI